MSAWLDLRDEDCTKGENRLQREGETTYSRPSDHVKVDL